MFSYTLFTKTLLIFRISLLKRSIYRRVNISKIVHGATIPVTLTKNQVKTISVHFIKKKLPFSRQDNICSFHQEKVTFLSSYLLPARKKNLLTRKVMLT